MNNYEEKIKNIKETEKYLLEIARNAITTQNKILNLNIQDLICMLNYDESTVKKYESTLKAQMLIEKFTNDILEAKDVDEIKAIRNRLNYYINKVKTEIKDRNVSEEEYNKYYENATLLRKNIARYVRFMKREENIKEIDRLSENIDSLNEDELNNLKRLLRLESDYGKRNKNPNPVKKEEKKQNDDSKDFEKRLSRLFSEYKRNEEPKENKESLKIVFNNDKKVSQSYVEYDNLDSYLSHRINVFNNRYVLKKVNKYDGSLVHNIAEFIKNIPVFRENKKRIEKMKQASVYYDRTPEFIGFIEYNKRDNSLMKNFKKVFKNTTVRNKERLYLEEHKNCIDWIKKFCHVNRMQIDYKKKVYEQ